MVDAGAEHAARHSVNVGKNSNMFLPAPWCFAWRRGLFVAELKSRGVIGGGHKAISKPR